MALIGWPFNLATQRFQPASYSKPDYVSSQTPRQPAAPITTKPDYILAQTQGAIKPFFAGPQHDFELTKVPVTVAAASGAGISPGAGAAMPAYTPPPMPSTPVYSLDELIAQAQRKADLMVDPQIAAIRRSIEEAQLAGERQRAGASLGYEQAQEDLRQQAQTAQRTASQEAIRRGTYGAGLQEDVSTRLRIQEQRANTMLGKEYARALEDIASQVALYERQAGQSILDLEANRANYMQSMLDELERWERQFGHQVAMDEFDRWLSEQQLALQRTSLQHQMTPKAPSTPDYDAILKQLQLQAFQALSPKQQQMYALDPVLYRQWEASQWSSPEEDEALKWIR